MPRRDEGKLLDIIGQRFGRLVVQSLEPRERGEDGKLKRVGTGYPEPPKYLCKCDCGNTTIVHRQCLLTLITKSCGCLKKEKVLPILKAFRNKAGNISKLGCKIRHRACGEVSCCWDCAKYEKCNQVCHKNPATCGNYRG